MDDQYTPVLSAEERAALREKRAKARRQKELARRRRQLKMLLPVILLVSVLVFLLSAWGKQRKEASEPEVVVPEPVPVEEPVEVIPEEPENPYSVEPSSKTIQLGAELDSSYAIVVDLQNDSIIAEKAAETVINPASMTKVLTLLVAAEHVTDLDDTFTMTIDITDYCFVNDCSVVGLMIDETVSIRELLYGCILPSGADASLALAKYVAGSHEAFVELMNDKLEELGLSETAHFTNCVGLYDENHHCTVYDMAMILKAAMDNDLCREVLKTRSYETVPTEAHPDGQILSNWFLRRIEDKDTGDIEVIAGKTGYVVESGSCAVSGGEDPDGNRYICVTGDASGSWKAIYDHVALYKTYCN